MLNITVGKLRNKHSQAQISQLLTGGGGCREGGDQGGGGGVGMAGGILGFLAVDCLGKSGSGNNALDVCVEGGGTHFHTSYSAG